MMLQRPQLPDDNNQETAAASHYTVLQRQRDRLISCWRDQPKHDDGRSLNLDPFCGILANGGEGAINQELPGGLPNRGQYPFLGSASGCGDDERTTATSGGAAAAPAVGTRRKREACTLKPGNEGGDKRMRGDDVDGLVPKLESPPISTITTAASDTCEGKSKASAPPGKSDYIHVRARRGQATDSHSLAERVRREKISKRMKILQDLVPGCSKIAGKAGMLDEILNYVQSLQRQVEFLSMKLAAVSPTIDFGNIDALFGKQTSCNAHIDCDRRKSRRGWPHM
ncbi:unnamed protein product [Spirodela intermedia]|uniref:BHLH domain-containing protein n=1 Tax=Spirodela intermedia TaxID=51605 RepID=A0A7I8KKS9_SPIIN|nr:unnamed protein product [Spirodela intermedia]